MGFNCHKTAFYSFETVVNLNKRFRYNSFVGQNCSEDYGVKITKYFGSLKTKPLNSVNSLTMAKV